MGCVPGATLIDESHASQMMKRQRSDLSDTFKISCSPDAESYFKRKAEALYEKACRGELEIEINSIHDSSDDELKVLPLFVDNNPQEFEVTDLSSDPILEVKPVRPFKKSSYESLYDATRLDPAYSGYSDPTPLRVGDRFQGTFDNVKTGSFENLYSKDPTEEKIANPQGSLVQKGVVRGTPSKACVCVDF